MDSQRKAAWWFTAAVQEARPNTSPAQESKCCFVQLKLTLWEEAGLLCSSTPDHPSFSWPESTNSFLPCNLSSRTEVQSGFPDRPAGAHPRERRLSFSELSYTMLGRPSDLWSWFPRTPRGPSKKTPMFPCLIICVLPRGFHFLDCAP
jgi:hypothetical protein